MSYDVREMLIIHLGSLCCGAVTQSNLTLSFCNWRKKESIGYQGSLASLLLGTFLAMVFNTRGYARLS